MKIKTSKAPPPFNGAGENKGSFAQCHVLEAGSPHSFNHSIRTYYTIPFVHLTSFSTPSVRVSVLTSTLSQPTTA